MSWFFQSVKSKENKVLEETLRTMRDWRRKAFPDKLVNHGSYYTSKIELEMKVGMLGLKSKQ